MHSSCKITTFKRNNKKIAYFLMDNGQQTTDYGQQTTDNRQQTTDNGLRATDNGQ